MTAKLADIPDPEYFADPALDQSALKTYLSNPADWAYARLNNTVETTPSLAFGTAFHAYMLGTGTIVSLPEGENFKKAANRAWRDEQIEAGNIVVSYEDLKTLERMKKNLVETRPDLVDMIDNGIKEHAIFWTDEKTGLPLKAKLDLIPANTNFLVDLKTSQSAHAEDFARESLKYGYHIQAEFYRWAVKQIPPKQLNRTRKLAKSMQFWVFEKKKSCDWAPYSISTSGAMAENARTSIRSALNGIARDMKLGEEAGLGTGIDAAARWCLTHGLSKRVHEVAYTDWMLREAENLIDVSEFEETA